jgi:hypothetical protein
MRSPACYRRAAYAGVSMEPARSRSLVVIIAARFEESEQRDG